MKAVDSLDPTASRGRFVAGAAATAAGIAFPSVVRAAATSIQIQLDFLPSGRYAPFYLAKEEGMYAKRGLDVTIATSPGTGPALQQLVAGRAQIAFVDIPSAFVLMGRQPDVALRSYAVLYAKAPETVFFFQGGKITKPKDLEGKTIATSAGSTDFELFPLFAAANGFDASTIKWVTVDPSAKVALLLDGKVDATTTYVLGLPQVQSKAKTGERIGHFTFGDYGVNVYGNGLIVLNDFAAANPQIVKNVVQATLEGYRAAFRDPAKAVAATLKTVSNLDPTVAAAEIKLVQTLAMGPQQRRHGIGFQVQADMQSTVDAVEKTLLKKRLGKPASDLYTNADLE